MQALEVFGVEHPRRRLVRVLDERVEHVVERNVALRLGHVELQAHAHRMRFGSALRALEAERRREREHEGQQVLRRNEVVRVWVEDRPSLLKVVNVAGRDEIGSLRAECREVLEDHGDDQVEEDE